MNYKKLKPEEKLRYVDTHSGAAQEWLEIAMQHGEAGVKPADWRLCRQTGRRNSF